MGTVAFVAAVTSLDSVVTIDIIVELWVTDVSRVALSAIDVIIVVETNSVISIVEFVTDTTYGDVGVTSSTDVMLEISELSDDVTLSFTCWVVVSTLEPVVDATAADDVICDDGDVDICDVNDDCVVSSIVVGVMTVVDNRTGHAVSHRASPVGLHRPLTTSKSCPSQQKPII